MIIDTLIKGIIDKKNPTVIGLDPQEAFIPNFILAENYETYGKTLKGIGEAFFQFNKMIIDETYDLVPAVKPQIAMYEKYGIEGLVAYQKTIEYAKSKGLLIIADIKRGDIASTGKNYADGHIGQVTVGGVSHQSFQADFVTINPYMGSDSVQPFIDVMKEYNKGGFILLKTSNIGSKDIQDLKVGNDTVFEKVGDLIQDWGTDLIGEYGFSSVGAVVGGTHREECKSLRDRYNSVFFLIPGYGAQGGQAEDIRACFNNDGLGGIVNSSRGIISAYKLDKYSCYGEKDFHKAARQATIDMKNDLKIFN